MITHILISCNTHLPTLLTGNQYKIYIRYQEFTIVHTLLGQVCNRGQIPWWSKNIRTQESCRYHCMDLCPQLKTYKSVTSEVINSEIRATWLQSNQQNIYHYFIYNRLMDYYHNKVIVQKRTTKQCLEPSMERKSQEIIFIDLCIQRFDETCYDL